MHLKTCSSLRTAWLFSILLLCGTGIGSQTSISGTVIDTDDNPLIGVTVAVQGTSAGTVTDLDGTYTLTLPEDGNVLLFSYTGYVTESVEVGTQTVIDIMLEQDVAVLDEVVVIGYGTQRRSDLTGSVASISGEDLTSQPINSMEQGMQGRLAGVQVVNNSAAPGGGISVRIRGTTSILNGSEPLYVVDGFPITGTSQFQTNAGRGVEGQTGAQYTVDQNPLSTINPSDIESIEILKDASATAIYGVRGANGVVLITTKRGQTGAPRLSYNGTIGTQSAAKTYDVLNAQEFQDYANLAETNAGNPPIYSGAPAQDYYWQDLVLRNAPLQNHQLSLSGGTDRIKYLVSAGYFDQEGIIKGSDFSRYSIRLNTDISVTDNFKIGNSLTVSRSVTNAAFTEGEARNGVMNASILLAPNLPIFQPDDTYTTGNDLEVPNAGGSENPLALINETLDETKNTRILGTIFGEYTIIPDLTARVSVGVDLDARERQVYRTVLYNESGVNGADVSNLSRTSLLNENTLNYRKEVGKSTYTALAGFTVQREEEDYRGISASGFATDVTGPYNLGGGSNVPNVSSGFSEFSIMSFIGRLNYNYADKYLLTVTGRRDGSSKFAADNKWAFFPSVAGAWRISSESFMDNIRETVDNIKLRVGYGVAGNQELPSYRSLALLQSTNYNFNGTVVNGYSPLSVAVPGLTWETTKQLNAGLDISLTGGKLNLSIDVYDKVTEDLLLEVLLPETSGITEPSIQNLGEMQNRGIEFALDALVINKGEFS
ncbi:MAG: SusC/RagA family TonB-linked outer membrane protein, partial [Lewinella sp.]